LKFLDGYVYFSDEGGGFAVGFHKAYWRLFVITLNPDGSNWTYNCVATFHSVRAKDQFITEMSVSLDAVEIGSVSEAPPDPNPTIH
jgi:hypothetical protein